MNWRATDTARESTSAKHPKSGGIDFDFDQPTPDAYRFKVLFCKQYNDGQLADTSYHPLANDAERLETAVTAALQEEPTSKV